MNSILKIDPTPGAMELVLPGFPTLRHESPSESPRLVMFHYEQCPSHEVPNYEPAYHLLPIMGMKSEAMFEAKIDGNFRYSGWLGNGAVELIPSGVEHQIFWDRPIDLTVLFLKPQFIEQVALDLAKTDRITLIPKHVTNDLALAHLGLLLKEDFAAENSTGLLYRESIATALAARLIQHHSTSEIILPSPAHKLSSSQLQTLSDYIHEHLQQEIRLTDLAHLCNLSEYHLCRIFKQSTGFSLYQYVLQQRVTLAQRLLQQTDLSIAHIALRCGFNSHSHLTRHFKRIVGVSPRNVRSK
jgi:AraC family transcriptional regulator